MILVTGASGLLGANIVLYARDLGREVAALSYAHPIYIPGVECRIADINDSQAVHTVVNSFKVDSIVHCAAATNVDWCEDHPEEAEKINVYASRQLAQFAADSNIPLLYVSTDSVFDGKRGNYSEVDETGPLNVYSRSKLRAEQEVLQLNPKAIIARVNIYGWNAQNKKSLAEWILGELGAGRTVPGFTDIYFSPLLVNDLAEVVLAMLDRRLVGVYHVVGSERTSKFEFAVRVAETFGFESKCVVPARMAAAALRAPRPLDVSLATTKIRAELGRTMPNVQDGLERFRSLRQSGYSDQLKQYVSGVTQ
jgi:dTDP-4-dehydrorhamnose reductase